MRKRKLLLAGLVCAVALVFAAQVRGNAEEEVKRLAELMGWKAGTIVAEFDANIVRSLKPGGRLAIIDFPARAGLDPVEGVPGNRGGHGIPQKIVIEELSAAGLQVEKIVEDWPEDSYCVLFVKR